MLRAIPYTSLWFGLIVWFLSSGSLLTAAGYWLYEDYLFAYDSKPATGIIERLYLTTSHGRHGTTTTRHVAYHYQADMLNVETRTIVEYDTYHALKVGGKIPILYLPAELANNRIDLPAEQNHVRWTTWGLSLAALVSIVVGSLICRYYLRRNKLYRFLLASGVSCQGIVDAVPYDLVGKNRVTRFYLTFTFTDSQGRSRIGRSWYLRNGDEVLWRAGNPVQVHFAPANSEKFTVVLKRRAP